MSKYARYAIATLFVLLLLAAVWHLHATDDATPLSFAALASGICVYWLSPKRGLSRGRTKKWNEIDWNDLGFLSLVAAIAWTWFAMRLFPDGNWDIAVVLVPDFALFGLAVYFYARDIIADTRSSRGDQ